MEEMKIPQRARAAMTDGALQTAGKGMLGVFDQAYNVFNRDPGPYGAVRGNSTTTTPETTPPAAQQDQASITIAQFSLLMDDSDVSPETPLPDMFAEDAAREGAAPR